jgi:nucleoside-diphosphate-sugar epimerase
LAQKVLITGITGLIGGIVYDNLKNDYEVSGLSTSARATTMISSVDWPRDLASSTCTRKTGMRRLG